MLITEEQQTELIDRVAEQAAQLAGAGRGEYIRSFVHQFYTNIPPDGLVGESPASLAAAALSL